MDAIIIRAGHISWGVLENMEGVEFSRWQIIVDTIIADCNLVGGIPLCCPTHICQICGIQYIEVGRGSI